MQPYYIITFVWALTVGMLVQPWLRDVWFAFRVSLAMNVAKRGPGRWLCFRLALHHVGPGVVYIAVNDTRIRR